LKIAFIPTIHTLETDNTDYHLALTHLVLKYPEYADFYKKKREQGDFVILDNSLIELGKAASLHKVLEAAEIINPSEIVLPDVFTDREKTLIAVDGALEQLGNMNIDQDFQLQAVAHGENKTEWKKCWDKLSRNPYIDCIAIPKVTSKIFGSRKWAIDYALDHNPKDKQIHLLGMWSTARELKMYSNRLQKFIRGVDTSIAIHCAIDFRSFYRGELTKPDWKIDLEYDYEMNDSDMKTLQSNQIWITELLTFDANRDTVEQLGRNFSPQESQLFKSKKASAKK